MAARLGDQPPGPASGGVVAGPGAGVAAIEVVVVVVVGVRVVAGATSAERGTVCVAPVAGAVGAIVDGVAGSPSLHPAAVSAASTPTAASRHRDRPRRPLTAPCSRAVVAGLAACRPGLLRSA